MKYLILVTAPPACGKTFISRRIAESVHNCVYLDKDALTILSAQIFKAANEEVNRSSDFFEKNIRDFEYFAIMNIAIEALRYNSCVIVNAPFSKEIRDKEYISNLKYKLSKIGAKLLIVWVHSDPQASYDRMLRRNSPRDTWKLQHWDEYISARNYQKPNIEGLIVINNSNDALYKNGVRKVVNIINGKRNIR